MKKILTFTGKILICNAFFILFTAHSASAAATLNLGIDEIAEFTGEATQDFAGYFVASAGDVNGDGFDDMLVGARGNDDGGNSAGAAYLVYGQSDDLGSASLSTAVQFTGEAANDRAGISVASAGDVNGDGFDDMLVGADSNDDGGTGAGAAYLIYGQAAALSSASLGTAVEFTGEAASDKAGNSVASAGDVNGDGYADILVGAYGNDDAGSSAGAAYLIYGQAAALSSASLSTAVQFSGEAAGDVAGFSVASAGDVNGDGYADILVDAYLNDDAAEDAGAAYLFQPTDSDITVTNNTVAVNTVECSVDTFTDPGATATDQYTDTALTVAASGTVTEEALGSYTVSYSVSNSVSISSAASRSVTVEDTTAPVIALVGEATETVSQGDTYTDAGATVTDACDSSITVTTTGTVDTDTLGTYTLTYSASDDTGNAATQVTRTVTVVAADDGDDPGDGNSSEVITQVIQTGGSLEVTYDDDSTDTITPFNGKKKFKYIVSQDNTRLLVTNGKLLKVYVLGEKVAQKKVNKKTPAKKKYFKIFDKSIYNNYDTVVFMSATKKTGKIVIFRLNNNDKLKKKVIKKKAITKRNAITLKVQKKKKRFITTFGKGAAKIKTVWKLKKNGKVKLVH